MADQKDRCVKAFRALETLLLDTVNIEPCYVKNLAEVHTAGSKVEVNFDTKTAKFGHMSDGKDVVDKLKKVLDGVGIPSRVIEDKEYKIMKKQDPFRVGDEKPALKITFAANSDSLEKLREAKESYAAELVKRVSQGTLKSLIETSAYEFKSTDYKRLAEKAGLKVT